MIQIQIFQAVLLLLAVVVSSVVVIANYRKSNDEQLKKNNEIWQSAVNALTAHNEALVERLKDAETLQTEQTRALGMLQGSLAALEKERAAWTKRNLALYDRCQEYRSQLARLGVRTEEPNGEEH